MELNKNCKNYMVTHSNDLVQSKYDLSLNAQKLIFLVASHIQPQDAGFCEVKFNVKDMAKILDVSNQNLYKELPKVTAELVSKLIQFKYIDQKGNERYLQGTFLSTAEYRKYEGVVILEFSPKVAPYLLQLNGLFTQYKLKNILEFNSKYSIRLYQILKAEAFKKTITLDITILKEILCLKQKAYEKYNNLKNKVIEPAIKEINENTDIQVSFTEKKEGRRIVSLEFMIKAIERNIDTCEQKSLKNTSNTIENYNSTILKFIEQLDEVKIKISPRTIKSNYDTYGEDVFKRAANIFMNKAREEKIKKPVSYLNGILENLIKDKSNNVIKQEKPLKCANFTEREYDLERLEKALLGWDD